MAQMYPWFKFNVLFVSHSGITWMQFAINNNKKGIARYWTKDKVLKKFWVLVKQCFVIILSCTWTPQWCEYDTQVHRIVLYWLQRRMYVCAYLHLCWFLFFYLFRHQCTEQRYSLDTTACCNISGAWKSMINNYFVV